MKAFVLVFFNKANPYQYMAAVLPLKIAGKLLRENEDFEKRADEFLNN